LNGFDLIFNFIVLVFSILVPVRERNWDSGNFCSFYFS